MACGRKSNGAGLPQNQRRLLYWHWSPNNGWAMDLEIHGWNECLITYVLAAAAPRYGVDPLVYHRGFATGRDFLNGKAYYDIKLPLGMPFGGPLFFTHYSFCGLDPHGLRDRYADYWQQNLAHARINHAHCVANPHGHLGYSAQCWGLTASDDPDGYAAHDPANDNGTISPTAALSSLPYTPVESLAAIRHFLRRYGRKVWGRYGFVDAFCERRGWYADTFLAIDQAPIIIMIENHRSGLLCGCSCRYRKSRTPCKNWASAARDCEHTVEYPGSPRRLDRGPVPPLRPSDPAQHFRHGYHQAASRVRPCRPGRYRFGRGLTGAGLLRSGSGLLLPLVPRDSSVVMDALRILYERDTLGDEALQLFEQFVHFSLNADQLDGRPLVAQPQWRERVQPDFIQYLRQDADLAQVHGDRVRGETRLNADGSLDISSWPRPQHDGISTRALTLTRWLRLPTLEPALRDTASRLLQADLHYTRRYWPEPSYDIWEEDLGLHYYTLCAAAAALAEDPACAAIHRRLDDFWDSTGGYYRSRTLHSGAASPKQLDIAVILAAVHTDLPGSGIHRVTHACMPP